MSINLCKINANVGAGDCEFSFGGIDTNIIVGNNDTSVFDGTAGSNSIFEVSSLSGDWFVYETLEDGFANQVLEVNGRSKSILQTINFALSSTNLTPSVLLQLEAILKSKIGFKAIVKMKASNQWYMFGATNSLKCETFEWNSGASETDENVAVVELNGRQIAFAYPVSEAAVNAILNP
jgi:hypothetical protein